MNICYVALLKFNKLVIKHIYFFSCYNIQGISTRYRGLYVLQELKKKYGIGFSFVYPGYKPGEIYQFLKIYLGVLFFRKKDSLIIFQKLHTNRIYTNALKFLLWRRHEKTIYDTDDADYLRYNPENIHHFMEKCDCCTVRSSALADYVKKRNKNVLLLSSPVLSHNEVKSKKNITLHIGWIGNYGLNTHYTSPYSHMISLNRILFPVLKELNFDFKLTLLGIRNVNDRIEIEEYFKPNTNIILTIPENINWLDENAIYREIRNFDLGVSPLINHDFNNAKSAFKTKQYLSCGVPVLGSPVGENVQVIKDGYNGYLCETPGDFAVRITEFHDMDQRTFDKFIRNALQVSLEYRIDSYCEKFFNHFNDSI